MGEQEKSWKMDLQKAMETQNKTFDTEMRYMRAELKGLADRNGALETETRTMREETKKLNETFSTLEREVKSIRTALESHKSDGDNLTHDIVEVKDHQEKLKKTHSTTLKEIEKHKKDHAESIKLIDRRIEDLSITALENKNAMIDALRESGAGGRNQQNESKASSLGKEIPINLEDKIREILENLTKQIRTDNKNNKTNLQNLKDLLEVLEEETKQELEIKDKEIKKIQLKAEKEAKKNNERLIHLEETWNKGDGLANSSKWEGGNKLLSLNNDLNKRIQDTTGEVLTLSKQLQRLERTLQDREEVSRNGIHIQKDRKREPPNLKKWQNKDAISKKDTYVDKRYAEMPRPEDIVKKVTVEVLAIAPDERMMLNGIEYYKWWVSTKNTGEEEQFYWVIVKANKWIRGATYLAQISFTNTRSYITSSKEIMSIKRDQRLFVARNKGEPEYRQTKKEPSDKEGYATKISEISTEKKNPPSQKTNDKVQEEDFQKGGWQVVLPPRKKC